MPLLTNILANNAVLQNRLWMRQFVQNIECSWPRTLVYKTTVMKKTTFREHTCGEVYKRTRNKQWCYVALNTPSHSSVWGKMVITELSNWLATVVMATGCFRAAVIFYSENRKFSFNSAFQWNSLDTSVFRTSLAPDPTLSWGETVCWAKSSFLG